MCGIAGGIWSSSEQAERCLSNALCRMAHRGPDNSNFELHPMHQAVAGLGHNRLSIIDLSPAGHQPMHSHDGRWVVVLNGEIYNYPELRTELRSLGHRFFSESDTEVLLTAWMEWGAACLPRLTGMFAFAILDMQAYTLTCVRDAFGIKPFFYAAAENTFCFASEIPALLELVPGRPRLNWQRAYDYLVYGDYDSTADTFFAGIHHLPPAHWMRVDLTSDKFTLPQRWWQPSITERPDWCFAEAVEQVREQFLQNVRLHLRSDVALGAALSGGIDSSAVVCAIRHLEPELPIHTFSFIAEESAVNEEQWVDLVNVHAGAIGHKVYVRPHELVGDLDDMIRAQGEPFGSTSIYAQYRVFQLAKEEGITVTLDGQGADEMLAGYSGYPGQRLRSLLETGHLVKGWQFWNEWAKWPGRSRLYAAKALVAQLVTGRPYEMLRTLNGSNTLPAWLDKAALYKHGVHCHFSLQRPEHTFCGRRLMAELACSLSERGLSSLLRHGDRNSMRFSLESRVPFLTQDMVTMLLSMPEDYLVSPQGETKHVFRAAMRGIVPDEILDRRDKIGFATPEQEWLFSMRDTVRQWLSTTSEVPLLVPPKVLHEADCVLTGKKPFSWQIWRLINFCRWYVLFFHAA